MKTIDESKKKLIIFICHSVFFTIFFASSVVFGLEKMDIQRLKAEKGQAGLDIGMDNVVIYHEASSIKVLGDDQSRPNYIGLENIKGLGTFATGYLDLDKNGNAGKLTIDIGNVTQDTETTVDDIPLVFLTCPDWSQNIDLNIGNINWCGKNIGSLDIRNFELPAWHVYLGTYNGSGIKYQLGFRTSIEEIRYNYGTQDEAFSVKGFQAAGTFTDNPDDNPSNPSTWKPSGEFRAGDVFASDTPEPASIDIGSRGDTDDTPVILMNLSATGSVRASEIKFGSGNDTRSFGPLAIDGIRVHSMKIEIPGRGSGNNIIK